MKKYSVSEAIADAEKAFKIAIKESEYFKLLEKYRLGEFTILNCPFCGGHAKLNERHLHYASPPSVYIACEKCLARSNDFENGPEGIMKAATTWNKRIIDENDKD